MNAFLRVVAAQKSIAGVVKDIAAISRFGMSNRPRLTASSYCGTARLSATDASVPSQEYNTGSR